MFGAPERFWAKRAPGGHALGRERARQADGAGRFKMSELGECRSFWTGPALRAFPVAAS